MAAPIRFLSGRQQQQKIGIQGSTENEKVLEVVGRVGIGTTVFEPSTELDIRGSVSIANTITVSTINATNIITTGTGNTFSDLQVSGISTLTGNVSFGSSAFFGDNDKINMGDNDDLQIFHHSNGTGVIQNAGSGQLQLRSDEIRLLNQATDEDFAFFRDDGAVELYYNDTKRFETSGIGITVTGQLDSTTLNVSGVSTFAGNINANGNIVGDNSTNISGINQVTATTFVGNLTGTASTATIATYTSEWNITSNGSSDYRFTGPGFDGTENDPTIYLTRGEEYKFTNNMGAHPFQIRTSINGSAYNDGVTNNGVSNGTLTWDVQMDAPNILYYQCTSHAGMVGKIYIGNSGSSIDIDGHTETDTLNVSGLSTFVGLVTVTSGDVHIAQRLFVGGLEVEGTGSENTFTGINTFTNLLDNTLGNPDTGSLNVNGGFGVNKNASFGDKVFVQNAIGINSTAPIGKLDVNGHTELDDVNVSAALTAASLNVTNKLTTTGLGISVANGTGNTAYIEGPSEIWIDPAPAGAGTTSGLVRIRGDLYVDGTEFIVDVDKVQLSDYRIGIATTAGTNALLNGAGLGIGSESIEKTITWNNATSALMSSENWNLASGKHYEIAGTDVLTSTTLGGGVVNSSLTSVGTLGSLTVSGDITANGNIVGDNATNISNINQVTATTFSGALSGNATSATTATNVTVADESSDTTCNVLFTTAATGNLAPKSGTNLTFNSANGTLTATEFSGGGAGLTGISASQVGAIADIVSDTTPQLGGNLDVNNKDITGTGNVNLTGIVTATNFVGGGAGLTGLTAGQVGALANVVEDTTPQLGGNLDLNSKLINGTGGINITGVVTATDFNSTSDENLKENIRTIEDPLAKVVQIRGVNFDWKETQKPSVGVVAQEVEKVFPELVQYIPASYEYKSVNYNGLIGLLIEVVKEQQTQINSLNERLSKLE